MRVVYGFCKDLGHSGSMVSEMGLESEFRGFRSGNPEASQKSLSESQRPGVE